MNNLSDVRYEYFEFHHACKGQKIKMVNPLVKKLQLLIENFRFDAEDAIRQQQCQQQPYFHPKL